ncbi:hypothetical protein B0H12DRAFT_1326781 [Mycena haematopus]|nr:hypothetical protein B0H12DRAFT_1326781 [Mycena haematopus]
MLDGFCALPTGHRLQRLHQALWPVRPLLPAVPRTVPQGLASYLETYERLENCLDDKLEGDDDDVENDEDDGEDYDGQPPAPPIYYLKTSSETPSQVFALRKGTAPNTLLVRDEYLNFLTDVEKDRGRPSKPVRYFLTGQPGKSFGLCYILFHLLASGQPVFVVKSTTYVTYFGPNGCERPKDSSVQIDIAAGNIDFDNALRNSWVLVDVDSDKNWMPADWIDEAGVVVWTCSPDAKRMRTFTTQSVEFPSEREEFLRKLQKKGPVPRSVFNRSTDVPADLLEAAVATAINKENYSSWAVDHYVQPGNAVFHCVFLVLPLEIVVRPIGLKKCYNIVIQSPYILLVDFCLIIAVQPNDLYLHWSTNLRFPRLYDRKD